MRGRLCNPRQGIRGKQLPFPTPLSISSAFVLHGAPPPSFQHSPSKNLALRFGSSFLLPKSAGGGGDIGIRSLSSVKPCARATDRDRTIDGHGHSSSLGGEKHDEERGERGERERKRERKTRDIASSRMLSHTKQRKVAAAAGACAAHSSHFRSHLLRRRPLLPPLSPSKVS